MPDTNPANDKKTKIEGSTGKRTMEDPTIRTKPPGDDGISFRAIALLLEDLVYQMDEIEKMKGKKLKVFDDLRLHVARIQKVAKDCQKGMTVPF